mgnify:CR=1 FL=1
MNKPSLHSLYRPLMRCALLAVVALLAACAGPAERFVLLPQAGASVALKVAERCQRLIQ